MAKKIVILTIPGIGTKGPKYSEKFEEDVLRFSKNTIPKQNIVFIPTRPFNEVDVDKFQDLLFDRIKENHNIGGILSLRKLALEALGDAVAFEHKANHPTSTYRKIHEYLKIKIIEANSYENAEIICVAASLGVHILSTYIWDVDNNRGIFEGNKDSDQIKSTYDLSNLKYLASIGCNIPLFVSGMPENEIKPFDKNKRDNNFNWENYYDSDDILGWPLQSLCSDYKDLVKDIEINTGQYVGSHMRYWKDNDFTKPFTETLKQIYS